MTCPFSLESVSRWPRRAVYFDKLIRGADLERHVHALARIHVDADIVSGEFREALVLDGDRIETDLDVEKVVVAAVVGHCFHFNARLFVAQRDRRFRRDGAGRVPNGPQHWKRLFI